MSLRFVTSGEKIIAITKIEWFLVNSEVLRETALGSASLWRWHETLVGFGLQTHIRDGLRFGAKWGVYLVWPRISPFGRYLHSYQWIHPI